MAEAIDASIDEFDTPVTPGRGRKRKSEHARDAKKRERNSSVGKVPVITCNHNDRRYKATTLSQLDINGRIPPGPRYSTRAFLYTAVYWQLD